MPDILVTIRRCAVLVPACVLLAAAAVSAADAGVELGAEDDLTVFGTSGSALDPDAEIKGFSVFGSTQAAYTGGVVGPGNVVVNGVLAVSSGAYFVGNSTFQAAGNIFVNDGTAGQLLSKNGAGNLQWTSSGALGDNLGDHTATTTLQMGAYGVNTSSDITAARYQIAGSTVVAVLPGSGSFAAGVDAGKNNTGGYNAFFGSYAGAANTTGRYNTFVGNSAGTVNIAEYNSFVGSQAGAANTTGQQNTFVGSAAGQNNISGGGNTFLGFWAGIKNTTGLNNTFLGAGAGNSWGTEVTGSYNSFVGYYAGASNTTGTRNTAVGSSGGLLNTTGTDNTFLGFEAGYYSVTGSANAAFGSGAGYGANGHSFSSSTLIGYRSGYSLRSGSADNIFLGFRAGYAVTTGTGNIIIGYNKGTSAPGANNELNIGGVLYGDLAARTIGISTRVPQAALDIVSTGTTINEYAQIWRDSSGVIKASMTATGKLYADLTASVSSGDNLGDHVATTTLQMGAYGVNTSSNITAARYQINGSTVLAILPGVESIAVGPNTGRVNTGNYSVFVGSGAGAANTSGAQDTFVGHSAGYSNTTGAQNTFVGYAAGYKNVGGWYNTFLGVNAGYNNTSGQYNTFLGDGAGLVNTTGGNNSYVGYYAGGNNQTGSDNIIIGYSQNASGPAADGELNIGGVLYGDLAARTIGISTRVPQAALDIVSTGTAADQMAQIWRAGDGVIKGSMSATGYLQAVKFIGDGSGLTGLAGDNLGNHTATMTLTANYGITSSTAINAGYYQINGSTMLAMSGDGTSIGVGVELGRVNDGSLNSYLGYSAGAANTTGIVNTIIGAGAGQFSTSGSYNSFVGVGAGQGNVAGSNNSYVGYAAGNSNTSGGGNAGVGFTAGMNNIGSANVMLGGEAGFGVFGNSFFSSSTLMGYRAGYKLTTGNDNILLGFQAGYNVADGTGNIVIGYNQDTSAPGANNELNIGGVLYGDLAARTIGISTRAPQAALDIVSTGTAADQMAQIWRAGDGVIKGSMSATGYLQAVKFIGDGSGLTGLAGDNLGDHVATTTLQMGSYGINTSSDITAARYQINGSTMVAILPGANSIAYGVYAGTSTITGGLNNVFVGNYAGASNTTGDNNVANGYQALRNNTTGGSNIATGYRALYSNLAGSNNIAIGTNALYNTTGSNNTASGYAALYTNTTGTDNVAHGTNTLYSNTTGSNNIANGSSALYSNTTGNNNVASGYKALYTNTTGINNTATGPNALYFNTTGNANTANGYAALYSNTTGTGNLAIGYKALYSNTDGANNTATGSNALYYTTGSSNTANGDNALNSNTTGSENTAVGVSALRYNETGSANNVIGARAGGVGAGGVNSFSSSTIMGHQAGYNLTTGSDNLLFGFQSGDALTTGARNIVIGYDQDASAAAASNELNIGGVLFGDLAAKTIGISTRTPQAALDIVSTGTAADQMAQLWRDGAGVIKGSMSATGYLQAVKFIGDGSGLTGLSGDNLGNHTATNRLEMSNKAIDNVSSITVTGTDVTSSDPLFKVAGSTLTVLNNGKVGIGTGTPAFPLDVYRLTSDTYAGNAGTNGNLELRTINNSGTAGEYAALVLSASSNNGTQNAVSRIINIQNANADNKSSLVFQTRGLDGVVERMRIDETGNVGLSTGAPQAALDVNGTVKLSRHLVQAADTDITLTAADFGKTITINSASAQTVTLPSVDVSDIGATFRIIKLGAGRVTVDAADTDTINDSGAGDTVYNSAVVPPYASIDLILVSAAQWAITGGQGAWITTD